MPSSARASKGHPASIRFLAMLMIISMLGLGGATGESLAARKSKVKAAQANKNTPAQVAAAAGEDGENVDGTGPEAVEFTAGNQLGQILTACGAVPFNSAGPASSCALLGKKSSSTKDNDEPDFSNLGGALSSMSGAGGNTAQANQQCKIPSVPESISPETVCPNGKTNEGLLNSIIGNVATAKCMITKCEEPRLLAIEAEVECFKKMSDSVTSWIANAQGQIDAVYERWGKDINTHNDIIEDYGTRLAEANSYIGDPPTGPKPGRKGLRQVKEELNALANKVLPQKIEDLRGAFKRLEREGARFERLKKARVSEEMRKCFMEKRDTSLKCRKKSKDVVTPTGEVAKKIGETIPGYIFCRVEQNNKLNDRNEQETARSVVEGAREKANQALEIITEIGDSMAKNVTIVLPEEPNTQDNSWAETPVGADDTASGLSHPTEIEKDFGDKLFALDGAGLGIHDFVAAKITECHASAKGTVDGEIWNSNKGLGAFKIKLDKIRKGAEVGYSDFQQSVSDAYTNTIKEMQPDGAPPALMRF